MRDALQEPIPPPTLLIIRITLPLTLTLTLTFARHDASMPGVRLGVSRVPAFPSPRAFLTATTGRAALQTPAIGAL